MKLTIIITYHFEHLKHWGASTHSKHFISLYILGLGQYSHYWYTIDTEINRNVSMRTSSCKPTDTDDGDSRKNNDYSGTKTIRFTIDFHAIKQVFKHIEFYLNYVEHTFFLIKLWYTLHRWSFCFKTSICWIQYRSTHNIHFVVEILKTWFWNLMVCTCQAGRIKGVKLIRKTLFCPEVVIVEYRGDHSLGISGHWIKYRQLLCAKIKWL